MTKPTQTPQERANFRLQLHAGLRKYYDELDERLGLLTPPFVAVNRFFMSKAGTKYAPQWGTLLGWLADFLRTHPRFVQAVNAAWRLYQRFAKK